MSGQRESLMDKGDFDCHATWVHWSMKVPCSSTVMKHSQRERRLVWSLYIIELANSSQRLSCKTVFCLYELYLSKFRRLLKSHLNWHYFNFVFFFSFLDVANLSLTAPTIVYLLITERRPDLSTSVRSTTFSISYQIWFACFRQLSHA